VIIKGLETGLLSSNGSASGQRKPVLIMTRMFHLHSLLIIILNHLLFLIIIKGHLIINSLEHL